MTRAYDPTSDILLFCPSCGKHYATPGMLGQWIANCGRCDDRCPICWDHLHNPKTVDRHPMPKGPDKTG